MNELFISGIIGRVEIKPYGQEGKVLVKFSLAVRQGKDKDSMWLDCTGFDYAALTFQNLNIQKGDLVLIKGSLGEDSYTDKQGIAKKAMKVLAQKVEKLTKADRSQPQAFDASNSDRFSSVPDLDDLPF